MTKRILRKFFKFLGSENRSSTECWLWTNYNDKDGYGMIRDDQTQRLFKAHRVSYEYFNFKHPENLFVLHSCDTPSCVNPAHLRLGTAKDNAQDCVKRNRHSKLKNRIIPIKLGEKEKHGSK